MKLTAGSRLGPYEILAPLGAGGMGEVYRARDIRLGREVALKVLPAEVASDPGRQRRFEQEARAASALNHPNIISVHDIGVENGVSFMVTELVDGETLRPLIGRGPVPVRKLIEVAAQIADGLAAAHAAGIVHRDLKPENIMVTRDGRVKILDFGLAKHTAAVSLDDATMTLDPTEPGKVMGTVGYMSPEQVRGATLDSRSDLFSFGVILHEMLSGKRTFAGETSADVLRAILREDAPDLPAAVPPGLAHIVAHCLEKEPQSRFQSTHDLAFGLRAMSGGAVAPAVKLSPPKRYVQWAVFTALVFTAIAAAYLLAGRFNKTEPPRYQRLTFRRGFIDSARFAPEGKSIIYGAAWDGSKSELYSTRIDIAESRQLGIAETSVASISSSGEMALVSYQGSSSNADRYGGLLARAPLSGGAPREMLKDVLLADWAPDGSDLAVVRIVSRRKRVEFPIGKVIHETSDRIGSMQVSPSGDQICLAERAEGMGSKWRILVLDRQGRERVVSQGLTGEELSLGWASPGEIWYEMGTYASTSLQAMSMEGRIRLLQRTIAPIRLLDISREGRVLVKRENWRVAIVRGGGSDNVERDYSWLDASEVEDVSRDRRRILLTEYGEGGGLDKWSVYIRNLDGSPGVRLGEGQAFAFSPDGAQALTMRRGTPPELVSLPTGAGEPYVFRNDGIVDYGWADWLPDGTAIVFAGSEAGHGNRLFVQDLKGGKARPFSPEGVYVRLGNHPISPDGRSIVALSPSYELTVYPLQSGEPRPIPGTSYDDETIRWNRDGRFLYVLRAKRPSSQATIHRVEAATGKMQVWKEIAPADPAGVTGIYAAQIASDDRTYFYSYIRRLSDLYLIEGLK